MFGLHQVQLELITGTQCHIIKLPDWFTYRFWKAHYINELSGDCIKEAIKHGSNIPSIHSTTHFYPVDGKVHEFSNQDTAWANRDARWVQVIVGVDPDPGNSTKVTQWSKDFYDGMSTYALNNGAYVNFMMEEGQERIKASYGDNYERLVQITSKYDPNNFFHVNQNIKPQTKAITT